MAVSDGLSPAVVQGEAFVELSFLGFWGILLFQAMLSVALLNDEKWSRHSPKTQASNFYLCS